ncbi:hypothetical protein [Chrysiogenes arsenatis]|uniref:hypothetical protein n=1 Tax=Chrysiogenes arsenatis TaxID=309797 RepID=UPI000422EE27|nr:hypothetical protein [Chrysiogenes arsenatis]
MGTKAAALSEDKKWRAEDDMRTLMRASEIRKDPVGRQLPCPPDDNYLGRMSGLH